MRTGEVAIFGEIFTLSLIWPLLKPVKNDPQKYNLSFKLAPKNF
jgi:hypothetical protein